MKIAQPNPGDFLKTQRSLVEAAAKQANLTDAERGFLNNALLQAKPTSPADIEALLKNPRGLVDKYVADQAAKKPAVKVEAPAEQPVTPPAAPEIGM